MLRRRTAGRLLLAAGSLAALALAGAGCFSDDDKKTCTLSLCVDSATLTGPPATGATTVEICRGTSCVSVDVPDPVARRGGAGSPAPQPACPKFNGELNGEVCRFGLDLWISIQIPADVTLTPSGTADSFEVAFFDSDDAELARHQLPVTYVGEEANGPGCGYCYGANATWE